EDAGSGALALRLPRPNRGEGRDSLLDRASYRSVVSSDSATRPSNAQKLRVSEGASPLPQRGRAARAAGAARRARRAGGSAAKARRDAAERAEEAPSDAEASEGGAREGGGRARPRDVAARRARADRPTPGGEAGGGHATRGSHQAHAVRHRHAPGRGHAARGAA